MSDIKISATKMTDAKVSFISLVERGANRIPFKIMKKEKPMAGPISGLDLGSLFARKAEKPTVELVGVVTMKGEGLDSVKGQIQEAGFAVDSTLDTQDNSVVFAQVDKAEGDGVVVRLSEHVALVTKGFSPYNMDMQVGDGSFADQCKAQGFYPGVRTAMEVAADSVITAAYSSTNPGDAAKAVSKMMDECKAYVLSLINGLPVKAFKLEEVFPEEPATPNGDGATNGEAAGEGQGVAKTDGTAGEGEATAGEGEAAAGEAAGEGEGVEKGTKEKAMTDEETAAAEAAAAEAAKKAKAKKDEETAPTSLTEEQVSAIFASKLEGAMETLIAKVGDQISAVQKGMQEAVEGMKQQVGELAGRVEKAEQESQQAVTAVKGTVVGGETGGDPAPVVQKSEPRKGLGEIDTAYMGHVRKRATR